MDFNTWTHKRWLTCENLHSSTLYINLLYSLADQPRVMANWDGLWETKWTVLSANLDDDDYDNNNDNSFLTGIRDQFVLENHWELSATYFLLFFLTIHFVIRLKNLHHFFFSSYNVWKHVRYLSLISRQPGW